MAAKQPQQPNKPDPRAANPGEPTGQNPMPVQDSGNNPARNDPMQASGDAPPARGPDGGAVQPGATAGGIRQAGPLSGPAQTAPAQGPGATEPVNSPAGQTGTSAAGQEFKSGIEILPTDPNDSPNRKFPGMDSTDEPARVGANLMDVVQHFRDATAAMRNKQWGELSAACGYLLIDFRDVLNGNLSFMPALKGASPGQEFNFSQGDINQIRGEFDSAVQEFERERVNAIAIVPSVAHTGWHQAGGPASGAALPRAEPQPPAAGPGMVGAPIMQPNWLALLLEIAPVLIDAIRRAINPR